MGKRLAFPRAAGFLPRVVDATPMERSPSLEAHLRSLRSVIAALVFAVVAAPHLDAGFAVAFLVIAVLLVVYSFVPTARIAFGGPAE